MFWDARWSGWVGGGVSRGIWHDVSRRGKDMRHGLGMGGGGGVGDIRHGVCTTSSSSASARHEVHYSAVTHSPLSTFPSFHPRPHPPTIAWPYQSCPPLQTTTTTPYPSSLTTNLSARLVLYFLHSQHYITTITISLLPHQLPQYLATENDIIFTPLKVYSIFYSLPPSSSLPLSTFDNHPHLHHYSNFYSTYFTTTITYLNTSLCTISLSITTIHASSPPTHSHFILSSHLTVDIVTIILIFFLLAHHNHDHHRTRLS